MLSILFARASTVAPLFTPYRQGITFKSIKATPRLHLLNGLCNQLLIDKPLSHYLMKAWTVWPSTGKTNLQKHVFLRVKLRKLDGLGISVYPVQNKQPLEDQFDCIGFTYGLWNRWITCFNHSNTLLLRLLQRSQERYS